MVYYVCKILYSYRQMLSSYWFYRYLFDGCVLYTVKRLHPDPMELFSIRKTDNENMRIMIKVSHKICLFICNILVGPLDIVVSKSHWKINIYRIFKFSGKPHSFSQKFGLQTFKSKAKSVQPLLRDGLYRSEQTAFSIDFIQTKQCWAVLEWVTDLWHYIKSFTMFRKARPLIPVFVEFTHYWSR